MEVFRIAVESVFLLEDRLPFFCGALWKLTDLISSVVNTCGSLFLWLFFCTQDSLMYL